MGRAGKVSELNALASKTGGGFLLVDDTEDVSEAYQTIFDDLCGVYSITFAGNATPARRISIQVRSTEGFGEALYDLPSSTLSDEESEIPDPVHVFRGGNM